MRPAVSARIRKRVGGFQLDVSLELKSGVTVLFGPSGAGKTLTLSALAGAVRPDEGRVAFGSEVMFDAATGIDRPLCRRGVGWVFQDGRLFPHLSVRSNLHYGFRRAGERARRFEFRPVVEALGLERLLERRPGSLSGGEAQRVGLGRALLSQPRVLLMDEPLASVDEERREAILSFIQTALLGSDLPVLYVTHSAAERDRLADVVVGLNQGRTGCPEDQGARTSVRSVIKGRLGFWPSREGAVLVHAAGARWTATRPEGGATAREGDEVEVVVDAADVVLALCAPSADLACACVEGRILSLERRGGGETLVRLAVGREALSALVSTAAAEAQGLQPGRDLFALVRQAAWRLTAPQTPPCETAPPRPGALNV